MKNWCESHSFGAQGDLEGGEIPSRKGVCAEEQREVRWEDWDYVAVASSHHSKAAPALLI